MNLDNCNIHVTQIDPHTLNSNDFARLNEVMQDMWADGIREFVQCEDCSKMHSKKDIFGHLDKKSYSMTVRQIMGDFEIDTLSCNDCWWKVRFVFGKDNMDVIRERLTKTRRSFLTVWFNENDEVVGFEDAYVDTLEGIFQREFESHYRSIGLGEIRRRIHSVLTYMPQEFLVLSNIWLLDQYRSFQNIFRILSQFFRSFPPDSENYVWITEIDEENMLHKISQVFWWVSLWIRQDPQLSSRITNIWKWYKSDLILQESVIGRYKEGFPTRARDLVSLLRSPKESVVL